jgi:hypothetical protein
VLSILSLRLVEILTLVPSYLIQIFLLEKEKIGGGISFLIVSLYYFSLMWGLAWPFAWVVRKTMMRKDRVRKNNFPNVLRL